MTEEKEKKRRMRGRRRMVWVSIWQDEDFRKLNREERLLVIGMITIADDAGRGRASEYALKADIFPFDKDLGVGKVKKMRGRVGRVMKNLTIYRVEGEDYFQFEKWGDYQQLNHVSPSKFPSPSGERQGEVIAEEQRQSTPLSGQLPANLSQVKSSQLNVTQPSLTEPAEAGRATNIDFVIDLTDSDLKAFLSGDEKTIVRDDAILRKFCKENKLKAGKRALEEPNFMPALKMFPREDILRVLSKAAKQEKPITNIVKVVQKGCEELAEKRGR